MILKVRDDKGGWVLIDQIASIQHTLGFVTSDAHEEPPNPEAGVLHTSYTLISKAFEYRAVDICGDDGSGDPAHVSCEQQPTNYFAHLEPDSNVEGRVVTLTMRNDAKIVLFLQFDGFILDDSGKTIEALRGRPQPRS